jgi:hypothetical protein
MLERLVRVKVISHCARFAGAALMCSGSRLGVRRISLIAQVGGWGQEDSSGCRLDQMPVLVLLLSMLDRWICLARFLPYRIPLRLGFSINLGMFGPLPTSGEGGAGGGSIGFWSNKF